MNIIGFVGSLRKESYNRKLMAEVVRCLPREWQFELIEFGHLPLFNEDLEADFPAGVVEIQTKIQNADGILIATPEFNRGIPGALKNMIDWASRGEREDCWSGKKVYIFGVSSGNLGTVTAQYDLRRIMLYSGAHVLGTPEFFLGRNKEKFDERGFVSDEATQKKIHEVVAAFTAFVGAGGS